MISFEQAREIVQERMEQNWDVDLGELVTLPDGFEDDEHWQVIAGAREALVDGDMDFSLMDPPMMLVDKQTGEILILNYLDDFDKIDAMTPVKV